MYNILFFFFNDTATTEIYTLSLHDALPISAADVDGGIGHPGDREPGDPDRRWPVDQDRSGEHTSELQSRQYLVCRLLPGKKKNQCRRPSGAMTLTSGVQVKTWQHISSEPPG